MEHNVLLGVPTAWAADVPFWQPYRAVKRLHLLSTEYPLIALLQPTQNVYSYMHMLASAFEIVECSVCVCCCFS